MAYCISICLDKKSENLTHSFKYDLSKVNKNRIIWNFKFSHAPTFLQLLQRILMSTRSINNHLVSTVVPYLTSRRQYKNFLSYHELDYEDAGNSRWLLMKKNHLNFSQTFLFYSCGEGDDYQFLNRNRNRHNRRLFRRLNNINHNHLDSQQIIPRQNGRLRTLFDRIQQEIEKYRREWTWRYFNVNVLKNEKCLQEATQSQTSLKFSPQNSSYLTLTVFCVVALCFDRQWRVVVTPTAMWDKKTNF